MNNFRKALCTAIISTLHIASYGQAVNATANAVGTPNSYNFNATVSVSPSSVGNNSKLWLAIVLGEQVIFLGGPTGITPYAGGLNALLSNNRTEAPPYRTITGTGEAINVTGDASGVLGGQVFIGYGTTFNELVANSRYANVLNLSTPSTSPSFVEVFSDVTKNSYPSAYVNLTNATAIDDTCLLTSEKVKYPASYRGAYALPTLANKTLSNVPLVIAAKDNWSDGTAQPNPNLNKGCNTDNRTAFTATLNRLKALGAAYVNIGQYGCLFRVATPTSWGLQNISDTDLAWMGQQAALLGMKVRLQVQVCPTDQRGVSLNTALNAQWLESFFTFYNQFMLSQAKIAQLNGFDSISLDWGDWGPDWSAYQEIHIRRTLELANLLRSNFSGKLFLLNTWNALSVPPELLAAVDYVQVYVDPLPNVNANDLANLSLDLLKRRMANGMAISMSKLWGAKSIEWVIAIPSLKDAYTVGWVEDGPCGIGTTVGCGTNYSADFSIQALHMEAALETIAEQTYNKTNSVNVYSYWLTDTMTPRDSSPHVSRT